MSQRIQHSYENVSTLFDDMEVLYTTTSEAPSGRLFELCAPQPFEKILDVFNKYYPQEQYTLKRKQYPKLKLPEYNKKNLILCFSGGKDSVAAAVHYKKNYNVYLYHMDGINKAYAKEYVNAENLASKLSLPLFVDKVSLSGNHRFTEHFMKNMLIANGAIHYGIQNGIGTKIAFGNYYTSVLADNVFDVCAGDCIDMWRTYEYAIKRIIPKFHIYVPLRNIATSYRLLLKNPELLPEIISCLGPYRYRQYWKTQVEEKYSVQLMPNRCGRCWKCCAEYIYFTDHNVLEYNEEYYKYCLEQLLKTQFKERGYGSFSIYELWNSYLFYPMSKSKLKGIHNAIIQNRKIKYT